MKNTEYRDYFILLFIGTLIGVGTALFHISLESLWRITLNLVSLSGFLLIIITVLSLATPYMLIHLFAKIKKTGCGTHEVLEAFFTHNGFVHLRDTVTKTIASAITIGLGGSAGPEGPSMLLGNGLASWFSRRFRVHSSKLRKFSLAGAAAGVSAIFRAPLTGILFALEIPFRRDIESEAFIEAVIASLCSYFTFILICGSERLFPVEHKIISFSPLHMAYAFTLGLASAFVAYLFIESYRFTQRIVNLIRLKYQVFLLPIFGGMIIGCLSLIDIRILGSGYGVIHTAVRGQLGSSTYLILFLLLAKIFATDLTLNFGGSGGLFIPSLTVGAILSTLFVNFLNIDPPIIFVAAGMAASLAATSKTPLTAVAFVAETCGPASIIPALIAAITSYIFSGNRSFFELQLPHRVLEEELALDEIYLKTLDAHPDVLEKIRAYQVMTPSPIFFREEETVEKVLNRIKDYAFRVYPIVDEKRRLMGYVSLEDLLALPPEDLDTKIRDLIRPAVKISPNIKLGKIAGRMIEEEADHIFVVDKRGRLIGIIADIDIIRVLINELAKIRMLKRKK